MSMQLHHTLMSQHKHGTASGIGSVSYDSVANCVTPEVVIYGKCVQNGTPTPDAPVDIVCNNNTYKCHGINMFRSAGNADKADNIYGLNFAYTAKTGVISIKGTVTGVSALTGTSYTSFVILPRNSERVFDNGISTLYSEILSKVEYELSDRLYATVYGVSGNKCIVNILTGNMATASNTSDDYSAGFYISLPINSTDEGKNVDISFGVMYVAGEYTAENRPSYEPYFDGGTIAAPELYAVGDVRDEYYPQTGKIVRRCGVKEVKAQWQYPTDGSPSLETQGKSFCFDLPGSAVGYNTSVCSHFEYVDNAWLGDYKGRYGIYSDHPTVTARYFRAPNESITTVAQFQAWLNEQKAAGTPVLLVYQLASPVIEYVDPVQITSVRGANIIEETDLNSNMFGIPFVEGTQIDVKYLTHS